MDECWQNFQISGSIFPNNSKYFFLENNYVRKNFDLIHRKNI